MNNKDIDIDIERELPKAILKWYIFRKTDSVVYIGYPTDPLYECLQEDSGVGKIAGVDFLDIREWMQWKANIGNYDIAILSECFEKFEKPEQLISSVRQLLNANGLFFLLAHNRFGIRYFCGDRDPYTGRNFDGIEDYRKASTQKEDIFSGRMYDKAKLKKMLNQTGFCQSEFLSVFPGLESPFHILKDGYTPNEELNIRCFPMYHYPDTVFLEEQYLYTGMIENNLFHSMANAFLIISSKSQNRLPFDVGNEVLHVTSSLDRGVNNALQTIIYKERVEKRAVYSEGKRRLLELMNHNNELEKRGIHMIPADLKDDVYRMPYSKGENALSFFRRIAFEDKKSFIEAMDRFYRIILQSSEISSGLFEDEEDQILERGYYDLVPLNCFVEDGEFTFFDQEFAIENCPVGVIVTRLIDLVYEGEPKLEKTIPKIELLKRYKIDKKIDSYRRFVWNYIAQIRNQDKLCLYYSKTRSNNDIVEANRKRMNYSEAEYERIFVNPLKDIGTRNLILFGSGVYTKRFLAMYSKEYHISTIIDNNPNKWGQEIQGVKIESPDFLNKIDITKFKVFICIKNYLSVAKQLETMGITDYGIFDTSRSYAKPVFRQEPIDPKADSDANTKSDNAKKVEKKKYHIGYVAGVFDMFHTGHVRLLQRAKELCDYLIVGVVSDEDCYRQKNKYPVISCEDRVEVVKACRYADQVEALPTGFGGIRDAYKMFQFDVQFSGDDHGDDGSWLAEKEYLNKHGADLVFFDYTKGISSTEIRERL